MFVIPIKKLFSKNIFELQKKNEFHKISFLRIFSYSFHIIIVNLEYIFC